MVTTNRTSKWRSLFQSERTCKKPSETTKKCSAARSNTLASKYRDIGKQLGSGAGGRVCKMIRRCDGTTVAVKQFARPASCKDRIQYARQILAEFYIGSRLSHVNIIKNLELLEESNQWYQVMEYAPYSLFDRVASRKMSLDEIRRSFVQICAAVAYLHACGFAHRDLKLENVVYNEQGIMKLIDFGVAAACYGRHESAVFPTGEIGCRPYMAPELFRQATYDPMMADVWSLGILYCCMILGHYPWKQACESDIQFARFSASSSESLSFSEGEKEKRLAITDGHKVAADDSEPDNETAGQERQPRLLEQPPKQDRELIQSMLQVTPQYRGTMKQVCCTTLLW